MSSVVPFWNEAEGTERTLEAIVIGHLPVSDSPFFDAELARAVARGATIQ